MTRRRIESLVLRAKLIGAYRRRDDLEHRGGPLDKVDDRIDDLEARADRDLIAEARRLAAPPG
ncbi:MAG: hypothetical protein AAF081_17790 [Actinomycetota bacterium]